LLLTCSAYDGWPHDGLCATYNPSTGLQERASIAGLLRAKIRTSDPLIYHRCATDGGNPFTGKWGIIPRILWPFRGVFPNEQAQAHPATAATVLAYSCMSAVALILLALILWIPRAPGPKPPPLPLLFLRQQRERRSRALPTALLGDDASASSGDEDYGDDEFGGQRRRRGRRRDKQLKDRNGRGADGGNFSNMNPEEEEEDEDGAMAVHEPTFRSLGARVNAYIPVTDRGFNGLLQPRDLKPLQPPSAPTLRLHTASGDDVCGVCLCLGVHNILISIPLKSAICICCLRASQNIISSKHKKRD